MVPTFISLFGIMLAVGVAAAGYILYFASNKTISSEAARRLFLLLYAGLGINTAILIISLIASGSAWLLLFFPANLFVFTQTVLNLRAFSHMTRKEKALAAALAASQVLLTFLLLVRPEGLGMYLLPGILLAAVWSVIQRSRIIDAASLVLLAAAVLFSSSIIDLWNPIEPGWFSVVFFAFRAGLLTLLVVLPAALIYLALKPEADKHIGSQLFRFGLAGLLPVIYAYVIYWNAVWDKTNDGLGAVFLFLFAMPITIASGFVLAARLPNTRRWAGFAHMVVVILLLYSGINSHWNVSYHQITEDRAARVSRALEQYYARAGRYPGTLEELSPRDLLFIPQPMVLRGESWCYQADMHSYRLGTIYREYFGLPISVRIYQSAGQPFNTPWECDLRLSE